MIDYVGFVFLREGTSDEGLVGHLRELLVRAGAGQAVGEPRDFRGSVAEKLLLLKAEGRPVDVVFCHRDANSAGVPARRREITKAVAEVGLDIPVIPVVPRRSLEAWLLTDPQAIREVVGRPRERTDLGLPGLARIEHVADPKDALFRALRLAQGGVTRRRRAVTARELSAYRTTLLQRLDLDGPVTRLDSWRALEADIRRWLAAPATWRI